LQAERRGAVKWRPLSLEGGQSPSLVKKKARKGDAVAIITRSSDVIG
jgi:hypothetical protein